MSDAAFKTAPFPAYTTADLRNMAARVEDRSTRADTTEAYLADMAQLDKINAEIARREAVAAGDVSQMTDGERLRIARAH